MATSYKDRIAENEFFPFYDAADTTDMTVFGVDNSNTTRLRGVAATGTIKFSDTTNAVTMLTADASPNAVTIHGILKAGTTPTTLTNSAGKILTAALDSSSGLTFANTFTVGANGGMTFYDNVSQSIFQINGGRAFMVYSAADAGTWLYQVNTGVHFGLNYTSGSGQLNVRSDSTTRPAFYAQAAASTAVGTAVMQAANGSGTVVAQINASGALQQTGVTFANLPASPSNGTLIFCSDCTIANPCASGGTGAFAKRLNGVWVCN